jgi:hypothetical protein
MAEMDLLAGRVASSGNLERNLAFISSNEIATTACDDSWLELSDDAGRQELFARRLKARRNAEGEKFVFKLFTYQAELVCHYFL